MTIFTIGYEGAAIDAFVHTLLASGVEIVVDVRAVAISRRKGFSKTALRTRVSEEGLSYIHLRDLGDPKAGREAARAGRWRQFESIYGAHLRTPAAQAALQELIAIATKSAVVLLCYEADPVGCHRTMIARDVAKTAKSRIVNLTVDNRAGTLGNNRAHNRTCEGLAPA